MMGCDRISQLPDYLLAQILSHLPIKDCAKTSVLSKSWEFTWLHVTVLDLDANDFVYDVKALPRMLDMFLKFNRGSCLRKFKIKYQKRSDVCSQRVMEWIDEVVHRQVQHLEVEKEMSEVKTADFMPKYLYVSKTLVSLKLVNVGLESPKFDISLPSLKTMHLENIFYEGNGLLIMQRLLLASPVLEDLTMDVPLSWKPKKVVLKKVPRCLSLTLEHVRINKLTLEGTGTEAVKYFLKNSAVLKKLIVSFKDLSIRHEETLYRKLITAKKLSPRCQVLVY
ncbi:putative F-box/FBD/LRR-repeat protein At5g44950 [Raphanus sativus]|uniref:F-box/FBD/LRR-repeat protein At5g44950 n=1 Tax=Raphanus sativus TaxID=3726 RepID=A0A6J0N4U9_RAPSA|nr:putative F-box/FBD/LRR-repeat protein At5g44950 [Raphanus sativus]XP_056863419.1 putative F-box/FBD/LRR-repeat protein At5g44950 [Raphanus sativus]